MAHIAHRHRRYRLVRNTQSERHINLIDRLAAAEESVEKEASVRFRDWWLVGWFVLSRADCVVREVSVTTATVHSSSSITED